MVEWVTDFVTVGKQMAYKFYRITRLQEKHMFALISSNLQGRQEKKKSETRLCARMTIQDLLQRSTRPSHGDSELGRDSGVICIKIE